ncbi:MAG: FG-GAP-like repeat-containing protein [Bacteroidota bacterium]
MTAQSFVDVTTAAGIDTRAIDAKIMAGGVVWFDYNNDRYPDLLFTNGTASTRLYRNDWDGTFTDVSEESGLLSLAGTMGAISGDFDADGYQDLFVTTLAGQPNQLLRNNGQGGFENISVLAGITQASYGASATAGDFDGDGDLDIYVANYLVGEEAVEGGEPNFFYLNEGDMSFREVSADYGLDDTGCGLGAAFTDLNQDDLLDIYLANDFGYLVEPNEYFRNDGTSFERLAERSGSAATINGMGIAKGDYDNDGDEDLYITNIRENPLFENTSGGEFFSYKSFQAGVALPELTSWGTSFTDFDLDGWLDLIVANGQVAEVNNQGETQTYFHNSGNGTFTDASTDSKVGAITMMGRGLAVADYDLDGYPDVAINAVQTTTTAERQEKAVVLRNEAITGGAWLAVETPPSAVKLSLFAGEQVWHREADGGSSYLAHSAVPVHFGAPAASGAIDSLVVRFTNQAPQTFRGIPWEATIGVRSDGSWYRITHEQQVSCAEEMAPPALVFEWNLGGNEEILRIKRTETELYTVFPPRVVELTSGDYFQGMTRTQDAVFVDTLATGANCPTLQPIQLRILPSNEAPLLYPNPLTTNTLYLLLPERAERVAVTISSASGAIIYRLDKVPTAAGRRIELPLAQLPKGSYVCSLEYAGQTTYHKLIRQ